MPTSLYFYNDDNLQIHNTSTPKLTNEHFYNQLDRQLSTSNMSVAPIQKSKSSTGSLNTSSTSLVISKESGVTLVHPDGKELPESFEYAKPEKLPGR